MSSGSERFHELLKEIGELHDKKQQDYGSDADPFANVRATESWGIPAWVGATIRLGDKVQRLKSMWRNSELANESVEDSLRDIAVYALIGLVLWEEQNAALQGPALDYEAQADMADEYAQHVHYEPFVTGGRLGDLEVDTDEVSQAIVDAWHASIFSMLNLEDEAE